MKKYILIIVGCNLLFCCKPQKEENQPVEKEETTPSGPFTLKQEVVASNIPVPWGMAFIDKDNILVTEKAGKVFLVNVPQKSVTDIYTVPNVLMFGQGGLLDIALHPQFSQNQWVYFSYAKNQGSGFTTALGRARFINGSISDFKELFVANAVTNSGVHFGSRIVFDKDGFLYLSIGDRGQMQLAQNTLNHIGCVLRLNDDGSVPADNPFWGKTDTLPEIWTFGNRNIQGMAVHPLTGEIWSHEHGPQGGDEINIMRKGVNHGWPLVTFGLQYGGATISTDTAREGVMPPIHYWTPSIAPCGMVFLTGNRYPGWQNSLFTGSLVLQHVNRMKIENEIVVLEERFFVNQGRIRNVALSPDGYLYIANETKGSIIKLIPEFE
jgi:glucose/arabinose dehydrogenase